MSRVRISRNQVVRFLRDAGWKYKDATVRVEIYGKVGCTDRVDIAKRDTFTAMQVRIVLSQAKFTHQQIEKFLREAVAS